MQRPLFCWEGGRQNRPFDRRLFALQSKFSEAIGKRDTIPKKSRGENHLEISIRWLEADEDETRGVIEFVKLSCGDSPNT